MPTVSLHSKVSAQTRALFAEIAERKNMTLSAYTASVLEDRAGLIAEMHAMSERLSRLEAALEDREPSGTDADLRAMVLETLLLVRQRAQPAERRAAEGTVEACGMKVWRPEA